MTKLAFHLINYLYNSIIKLKLIFFAIIFILKFIYMFGYFIKYNSLNNINPSNSLN